jgi:hypothetical protein
MYKKITAQLKDPHMLNQKTTGSRTKRSRTEVSAERLRTICSCSQKGLVTLVNSICFIVARSSSSLTFQCVRVPDTPPIGVEVLGGASFNVFARLLNRTGALVSSNTSAIAIIKAPLTIS